MGLENLAPAVIRSPDRPSRYTDWAIAAHHFIRVLVVNKSCIKNNKFDVQIFHMYNYIVTLLQLASRVSGQEEKRLKVWEESEGGSKLCDTSKQILLSLHSVLVSNWTSFVLWDRLLLKSMKFRGLFHSRLRVIGSHVDAFLVAFHIIYYIDIWSLIIYYNDRFYILHFYTIKSVKGGAG